MWSSPCYKRATARAHPAVLYSAIQPSLTTNATSDTPDFPIPRQLPETLVMTQTSTMDAFLVTTPNKWAVQQAEVPTAKDGEVVIRVKASAVNPLDAKMAKEGFMIRAFPSPLGVEISGIVSATGPSVTTFKVGDAVIARAQLNGFAEYATATVRHTWHKPANLSYTEAATIPVGTLTAVIGLFSEKGLKISRPRDAKPQTPKEYLLVWGGSSTVGSYAVQLATAAGYKVIATASPKQHKTVLALGAAHVVDYNAPDAVEQIRKLTGGEAKLAFDAVGGPATAQAAAALRADVAHPSTIVTTAVGAPEIPAGVTLLPTIMGFDPTLAGFVHEVIGDELLGYFAEGKLKPSRVRVVDGGLEGLGEALELLAAKKVSGEKLVLTHPE
ncbi:chaperonin 10-like protein [Fimicolochytrium jonesii]|uniref:chaperonin 10-like protein n=1 Tax=Fimicolochytrium jonesii TaxID=1396493 RepID=UPI0022FE72CD|nr:chaperonin 10-like protein [Fimicolochytrium jonesii]KAI8817019.1 chaperonin 10-like protein [Fimicolochytrium jonesii]